MKLLSPDVGWAATHSSLFWTTDGGRHWKDVSPEAKHREVIYSVFFLDTSVGWVLRGHLDESTEELRFDLASTTNAGTNWSVNPVKISHLDPARTTLTGGGCINFVDSLHGWMNLAVLSSANFRLGILLVTTDGGRTWNWVPEGPGVSGTISFATLRDGWLAGGPGNQELYATHDGSKSWQKVSRRSPFDSGMPVYPIFDQTPIFENGQDAFLPVTFPGPKGVGSKLVLFASHDAGETWKPDRDLPLPDETSEAVPSTVTGSTWITASLHDHRSLAFTAVMPGGHMARVDANIAPADSAVWRHSFVSAKVGWVLTSGGLLSTTNGGTSWVNITPSALPGAGG